MATNDIDLVRRDDLPNEVIEEMQKMFPGMEIVCAGDVPSGSMPAGMQDAIDEMNKRFEHSIVNGTCLDCGVAMPGYPTENTEEEWDNFQLPAGWSFFTDNSDNPQGYQCPECDAKERDEDGE